MDTTMINKCNRKFSNFASQFFLTEKRHNMGLEVPTSSPPKSPLATSPNPNIMPNSCGELQVLSNSTFKHCSTKYNNFTIPKHLNSGVY